MQRLTFILLVVTGLFVGHGSLFAHSPALESKLKEVDGIMEKKAYYDAQKEDRIVRLRGELRIAMDNAERWDALRSLYREYTSYKYDSAYNYALQMGQIAAQLQDPDKTAAAQLAKTYCLINAGLYKEAFDAAAEIQAQALSPRTELEYHRMMVRLYYSARGYALTPPYFTEYSQKGEYHSLKILEIVPRDSQLWHEYKANLHMENREFEESRREFSILLARPDLDLHSRAIYASSLGWVEQCLGLKEEALLSICESVICDVMSSTKETTALRMLAEYLSNQGEVDRPSWYIRQSFDDANFYNARLRKLEVGAVLPIVEKNHYERVDRERKRLLISTLVAIFAIVAALGGLFFIKRQNRRLHEAREEMQEHNQLLKEANDRLAEANAIKTEYIGNSFYITSEFIEKMSQMQKLVDRMLVTHQYDELRRSLKESAMEKERNQMYESFDTTFLKIFPTFVNDYNALFPEPEQVFPKNGLTPEMRIFALIRLGITETDKIARFLDYSIHTINTYKTRVKNKSWVENEHFEEEIMKTGTK